MTLGTFIQPDRELETLADPNEKLGVRVYSGYRAINQASAMLGQNRIFDEIWRKWNETPLVCEDQCSAQYYYDLVRTLRDFNGEFTRLVEVGVYMGGASSIFAGCMDPFRFELDLVDINANFLRYAHERARRMYPHLAGRIRLFHGDLPSYVRHVMMEEAPQSTIIHHDGAHDFNQVVKDMSALSFVQDQLFAVIAQDTHLRGSLEHMNFVDMAMHAVFGIDLNYAPIGAVYHQIDALTYPNEYQGNYFRPGVSEGFVLPMSMNEFVYPHPTAKADAFLPPARQARAAA